MQIQIQRVEAEDEGEVDGGVHVEIRDDEPPNRDEGGEGWGLYIVVQMIILNLLELSSGFG
jgi:hypothetical protein